MSLRILAFLCCLFTASGAFAVRVFFDYKVFHIPGDGPYVEFITSFDGSTFTLAKADSGMFQSHAELTIIVSRMNEIVDFRKVAVDGPVVPKGEPADFLSMERFMLPTGVYDLELEIRDLDDLTRPAELFTQKMEINNLSNGAFISDIEFISAYRKSDEKNAFSKSGYDMLPYVSNYFPSSLNAMIFYAEIYGTDSVFGPNSPFVSNICVVDAMDNTIENCKKVKREMSSAVVPVFQTVDISDLPTGDYKLRLEIRNKENQLVYLKERKFSRSRIEAIDPENMLVPEDVLQSSFAMQYTDVDSLYAILQSHLPIAKALDRSTIDNQLEDAGLHAMQSFFYTFWYKRNPADPEAAWRAYEKELKIVNNNFGTKTVPGWRSDRGRVYLQYGKPNTRTVRPSDMNCWPYEMWHYYETNNKLHDRRFVFYDNTLAGNFTLLHTDATNDVKNYNWIAEIKSRGQLGGTSEQNSNQNMDTHSRDELEELWFTPH